MTGKHSYQEMTVNAATSATAATSSHNNANGFGYDDGSSANAPLKMKVTVCFGNVRVIVPCPNQEMLVRDLIHQAMLRYKKATGKGPDSWVVVHKVKSQQDGAIFDPDDRLIDVADDREQIMAIYEEDNDGMPSLLHNAGDGTSASSVGTNSPEPHIFQGNERKFQPVGCTDIEITGEELSNGQGLSIANSNGVILQVRRGSEPALNRLSPVHMTPQSADTSKRWSAAPVVVDQDEVSDNKDATSRTNQHQQQSQQAHGDRTSSSQISLSSSSRENSVIYNAAAMSHAHAYTQGTEPGSSSSHIPASKSASQLNTNTNANNRNIPGVQYRPSDSLSVPGRFSRENNRLSMQIGGDFGSKWADAADRALSLNLRKEPVGANASESYPPPRHFSDEHVYRDLDSSYSDPHPKQSQERASEFVLPYDVGPLGVHLVPLHQLHAKNQGLIIQSIEKGGRIDRDGRLEAGDKIVEINGTSVLNVPFQQAQEFLREGLSTPQLKLKVVKHMTSHSVNQLVSRFNGGGEEKENMVQSHEKIVGDARVATVSPTKKMPLQAVPLVRPATTSLIASNTRKIGRKYEISLQKGVQGLGFSITTRDNPAGGNCPIYIKNILPTGAAIDDGRLRPGDRLLEVNSIEITGKSQSEAVSILRNVPLGGVVNLIVSRQERVDLSPKLPRQIPPEKIDDENVNAVPWSEREVSTLDIPVLDTEKAGLGISVKGKTTVGQGGNMVDMGIFIKSVIHGGAASRDGRLKSNDQLMSINGISLLNRSNTDAMETLRRTMTQDGPKPKPGFITIMIARRAPSSSAPTTDISACGSSASGDEMESWGSKNVSLSADGSRPEDMLQSTVSKTPENVITINNNMAPYTPPTHGQNSQPPQQHFTNSLELRRSGRYEPQNATTRPILDLGRNPVLERLTSGKSSNQATRNESYYRATNETRNAMNARQERAQPLTVQNVKGEMILFEQDYTPPQKPPRRSRSSTPVDGLTSPQRFEIHVPGDMVSPQVELPSPSDVTYASQTSLEEDAGAFARDAFGRQSMSEKRHATLDAKSTDTYQRNKKLKEERERTRDMQLQQEGLNQQKRAEQLARERNLQDELARRGIKRPFSASTEDDMHQIPVPVVSQMIPSPRSDLERSFEYPESCNEISPSGRRGLGDQLKQLLTQWGHRQTPKQEDISVARINSADSLVDAMKQQQLHHQQHTPQRQNQSRSSHGHGHGHGHSQKQNLDSPFKGSGRDIGPSLGMKKSSSLESLQTMVQEIQIEEDVKAGYGPARSAQVRVVRGRGCNESFRQAVDRSYEAPLGELGSQMETLDEEEDGYSGGNHYNEYPRPSDPVISLDPVYGGTTKRVQPPLPKKKTGLFRGLGSMFRFGRHRKSQGSLSATEMRKQQIEIERMDKEDAELAERDKARQAAYVEQMRIQEQYRRLVEKQQKQAQQGHGHSHPDPTYGMTVSISNKPGGNYPNATPKAGLPQNFNSSHPQSQIRPQFRKSMDVPSIRERERERARELRGDINGNPTPNSAHARSSSYDVYNEMTRPGSRVGVAVEPKKYSHYINYDEIRHHLNKQNKNNNPKSPKTPKNGNGEQVIQVVNGKLTEGQLRQMRNTVVEQRKKAILDSRRHQQHYHSQRREHPRDKQERPMSNFYEYESVQAGLPAAQLRPNYIHQMNNNGVTLPSPTGLPFPDPHSHSHHQRSPSQFQVIGSNQHKQMISQITKSSSSTLQHTQSKQPLQITPHQPRPNSLPRRSQRDLARSPLTINHQQYSLSPQQQQQQYIQQQQPQSIDGRYITYPNQQQHIAHSQQSSINNHNHIQQSSSQSHSSARLSSVNHNHNHSHSHQAQNSHNNMYRSPPASTGTVLGSKV